VTPTERRRRITAVFELAIKLEPEDQRRFLERECRGDNALLEELTSLISAYRDSGISAGGVEPEPASDVRPAPARIGRYEVTGMIGSGGFGHVYRALDPAVGRAIAIKVLSAPGDRDLVKRFRAEATTLANLHHKNIVTVYEFGEENGAPYLVMEYLEGTNLQDLLRLRIHLSLQEKLWIMSEVAEGLQCAHDRGVIHRDVKPANIMRMSDGSVKIMDFGIARFARATATRLTHTGLVIGTLLYMAPEQFSGTADALTDIFAFGVTSYELLTGRHPFPYSDDPAVMMHRIIHAEPEPLRSLLPECPESIEHIVNRALAKSREARYTSLADVVVDTKPILQDLRRQQAGELFSQAHELLHSEQLEAAQSAIRKALELDPWHTEARQLRSRIEGALHNRDLAARAGALLDRAEQRLSQREFQEAAECLDTVKQMSLSDSRIDARLKKAYRLIEQARNAQLLLDAARQDLRKDNLTEAFRGVSQVLAMDPENVAGRDLLQEIQIRMTAREAQRRIQEDIARAESLLSIGENDEALALLEDVGRRDPSHKDLPALRTRGATQKAEAEAARRLGEGAAAVRDLLKNREFAHALGRIDRLLVDFPDNPELMALRRYAAEQVAVQTRAESLRQLKAEAAAWIDKGEYDHAIHALEAGVAFLGDDADLTRLLQASAAGKAAFERERAVARVLEDTERQLRQGKFDEDAPHAIRHAIESFGNDPRLQRLLEKVSAQWEEDALRRSRPVRLDAVPEDGGRLAGEERPQETLGLIDQGLAKSPHEPALVSQPSAISAASEAPGSLLNGKGVLRSLLASLRARVATRATIPVVAVAVGVVLIAGFWILEYPHASRPPKLQALVQGKSGAVIGPMQKANSTNSPALNRAEESEWAALRDAITKAIAARQWSQARLSIPRLQQLASDPRVAEWLKQIDAGLALDREVADLRSSIQKAMREGDLSKAEAETASLLGKIPHDPQGQKWQQLQTDLRNLAVDQDREGGGRGYLGSAEGFLAQGDYQAAIDMFQRWLEVDPASPRAKKGLKQAIDAKATEDRLFGKGN